LDAADAIVRSAWEELPHEHHVLLERIGVTKYEVVGERLGFRLDELLVSAGERGLGSRERADLDRAVGVWSQRLGVVLVNAEHPALTGAGRHQL